MNRNGIDVMLVVALVAVALVVPLALFGGGGRPAISVNGHQLSQGDFDDQLDRITSTAPGEQLATTPGAVSADVSTSLLTVIAQRQILADLMDDVGLRLTAQNLNAVDSAPYRGLPQDVSDLFVEREARAAVVRGLTQEQVAPTISRTRVEVDPRYGSWDKRQLRVCPPRGCTG